MRATPAFTQHVQPNASPTPGPLPKSDSVQSLVSLINPFTSPNDSIQVRATDPAGNTRTLEITPETDFISLSGQSLITVSLAALHRPPAAPALALREISLAANSLHHIDLSPLVSCPTLTVLSLNSNRIVSIDLSPLSACKNLQRLWLHDNRLEHLNLDPLVHCTLLRSLYLEDNSLHDSLLDLTPLSSTQNLRSLRLGGNRLAGNLDLTPLLQCPALSVFNVDSSVKLVSDGEASQARVSPALRRIVLDVTFTGRLIDDPTQTSRPVVKRRTTPPVSPTASLSPTRLRHRVTPDALASKPAPEKTPAAPPPPIEPIVKVLLVGFRRLARYATEDSFTRCGKIMIRASNHDVASTQPALLLDSHLVILYGPSEKTLRQVTVVVGRIPTVVIGSERYRSTADNRMLELLDRFNFYADPLDPQDTRVVYDMGKDYATGAKHHSTNDICDSEHPSSATHLDSSPVSEEDEDVSSTDSKTMRRSFSESNMINAFGSVNIELEDFEDEDVAASKPTRVAEPNPQHLWLPRSHSADGMHVKHALGPDLAHLPATTWSELTRRLRERRGRKGGRGWGSYGSEMSMHGKNKLRAERAGVGVAFLDLGGYATADTCASIARSCGLPKCAGPLLFGAAYGSAFEIESTTPEAGVPNPPIERKSRRISVDAFLAYWETRLKTFDGEERLSNILEDSHFSRPLNQGSIAGHSRYGAPYFRKAQSCCSLTYTGLGSFTDGFLDANIPPDRSFSLARKRSTGRVPSDISCPCDAGIEALITAFMGGRSSRFGSFALVKMSEAIAIGSALVMYGLRGTSKNRVGGQARPVCPKEVREGKLNAALIAAEVGIFEGVASGLSMDQIRSVKGCYATEASPDAVARCNGIALNYTLSLEDVQRFCISRKTLLPGAVEATLLTHCRKSTEMTLSEFSVFLSVLNNISSNGAVDYFFTVVDTDQNERWTLPDLRHFHMEKEKMWLTDGMAVSELVDLWMNLIDMIRPSKPQLGISRREFRKLGAKERKLVLQSLLFVDDDHSLLNIRRTMELTKNSTSTSTMVM